jgi:hypothetical protein
MEAKTELKYIFANINELLRFAEAKHGGLIILNSGFCIGLLSSYSTVQHVFNKPAIIIGLIAFGISVFLSLVAQFPITQNTFFKKKNISNPNLYFYGHLSNIDDKEFISSFKQIDNYFNLTKFDTDLINQILVNSRITNSKFIFFKFSIYLTAFGSGILGLTAIIKVLCHL